jgi:hypothetical protein
VDLTPWQPFFLTTASVSGALVGLLFVAISIHLRTLASSAHTDLRLDAVATLFVYITTLLLSLLPLMPQGSVMLGYEILLLLALLIIVSAVAWPRMFSHLTDAYRRRELALIVLREAAGAVLWSVAAVGLIGQQTWAMYAFALVVVLGILLAIARTWGLIFRAAASAA